MHVSAKLNKDKQVNIQGRYKLWSLVHVSAEEI